MDVAKLRAWWFHRQGLDGKYKTLADTLTQCGWARSVGGLSPYLGFFARAGIRRQAVDDAVASLAIHELPAARQCTHVVAAADYPLALRTASNCSDNEMKVARKLGVTDEEVTALAVAVRDVLSVDGPLTPDELKQSLGAQVRNLGEEGRRKGITTTLPLALGTLQVHGRIRRIPVNGRLDQQRYRYALWDPSPLANAGPTDDVNTTLARRYFQWIGPATLAEFQWFSGLGVKAAKAAVEPLHFVELDGDRLLPTELSGAFAAFKVPRDPCYSLVGSIDGMLLLRRDLKSLTDEADLPSLAANVADLPSHPIFDRGRLIGMWEYDPETQTIAWKTFRKADSGVSQAVAACEDYIRTDLGDVRAMSLDSPKSRAPRIAALRGA